MHHSHGGLSGIYAVTLPPLSTLPSWSRSSLHHKQKISLQPDKLRPLVACTTKNSRNSDHSSSKSNSPVSSDKEENILHVLEVYKQKVKYLSGNIDFLKSEHAKILKSLHEEIELMKYENKELKFKLIISDSNNSSRRQSGRSAHGKKETKSAAASSPLRNKFYEEEISSLQENLHQEKNRNKILQDEINNLNSLNLDHSVNDDVQIDFECSDVPNTIEECYAVISALRSENDAQQKEMAYYQAKLNQTVSPHQSQSSESRVMSSLPALRPALQSKVVHRMKRQQVICKEKLRNDVLRDL